MQTSVLVLTVGLLPLGIGCNSESGPVQSDSTGLSAKEDGTETTFKSSDVENNEDALDGERQVIEYRIQEIEEAVDSGAITPEEGRRLIEETRRGAEADDGRRDEEEALREFQRGVAERAMAIPPEEWNDRLKAAIVQAGWDLNEFTEGIRGRQAAMREGETANEAGDGE